MNQRHLRPLEGPHALEGDNDFSHLYNFLRVKKEQLDKQIQKDLAATATAAATAEEVAAATPEGQASTSAASDLAAEGQPPKSQCEQQAASKPPETGLLATRAKREFESQISLTRELPEAAMQHKSRLWLTPPYANNRWHDHMKKNISHRVPGSLPWIQDCVQEADEIVYVGGHDPGVVSNMRLAMSRMPKLGGWKWQNIPSPIIENSAAGAYVEYAIRGVGPAHPDAKNFKPLQPLPAFLHFFVYKIW